MAHKPLLESMLDHPRITVIAADLMPAGTTHGDRRIAAPVDEQQGLLALFDPCLDLAFQTVRNPAGRGQFFRPHVDRAHLGQHGLAKARVQLQLFVFSRVGIHPAFQRWRGRGQHHLRPADRGPQHRHIPRIVKRAVFLLVAGVVFLIDDNQTQIAIGQKQG